MVLCAMMALTLAGCGGSSDDSSTYTYSSELDIKNLDSSDADDGCSFTALHAIIDGLMKPAKDGTTTYGIAKSSEVSEDGLTHTYKLRDAKWSNGDAVTANDFVYAWQRIFKKKGNYYYMFCDGIANIAGAQELSDKIDAEQDLTDEDLNKLGVKAVDDKTLEITTTTRVSFFDELMSFPCFYPINEKFFEKIYCQTKVIEYKYTMNQGEKLEDLDEYTTLLEFTPEKSGYYKLYTTGLNTGTLRLYKDKDYTENCKNYVAMAEENAEDCKNVTIEYYLKAGETYSFIMEYFYYNVRMSVAINFV